MKKLAVLISNYGTGTNLQAIIDATESKKINAKVVVVVSNTNEAQGLLRAGKHKIQTAISPKKEDLIKILKKYAPDYIILAGWKQIVTDQVIDEFPNKILNLHPGLIPDSPKGTVKNPDGTKALWNKGKLANIAVQNFLDQKATYAGSSVHFLTHEFDFGPVLERAFVKIIKGDSVESLYSRLKVKEHEIYVKALQALSTSTVLVIDGGGRGSALVDKYQKSPHVSKVLAAPGNDLMLINIKKPVKIFPDTETTDIKKIKKICTDYQVDFVDVAQDNAVAVGVTDALRKQDIQVFGPTKAAGQIEWDKAWARNFMKANNIPSPAFKICKSEKEGIDFLKTQKDSEWYIKASGLAAGKGVIYAKNNQRAKEAISQMKSFGKSGETFLIEECLHGEEFSSFAFVDGADFVIIGHAQDHKRAYDGDKGPNTGGMGCSSPPKAVTPKIEKQILLIFQKTTKGLAKIKRPYRGVLYLGGMIDYGGKVYVVEFNARWGDPEAQVIIPSIKNDLYEMEQQILSGNIKKIKLKKDNKYRIVVTAASKGYPNDYSNVTGRQIKGLDKVINVQIFGAGIRLSGKKYIAGGGRLFYVMAEGRNVQEARTKAYNALSKIKIERNNLHFRRDIGYRDLARL
ncbi:MAG: phosphoribosylamine--glycine ligase [Candidatus Curtissbacteria bacterium]|nr:phosphoribosylamine--glycine ligase [Candidatus Curtissbacteria bacterium]